MQILNKKIITTIFFTIISTACAFADVANQPPIVKETYPNGSIKAEKSLKDGKLDGTSKWFHENGKIAYEASFINGKRDGSAKEFYENGNIEVESQYKDGKITGTKKTYYDTGELKSESLFVDGKPHGIFTLYFKNKQIHYTCNFVNGEREGICKYFYESGKPRGEVFYHNGKWQGSSKEFYESGSKESEANFDNGNGLEKRFYESGELKEEMPYIDNDENGVAKGFYKSGEISYEDTYKKGKKIKRQKYSEDGKIEFNQNYSDSWFWRLAIALLKSNSTEEPKIHREYTDNDVLKSEKVTINKSPLIIYSEFYKDKTLKLKDYSWNNKKISRRMYDENGKLKFRQNYIWPGWGWDSDFSWWFWWIFGVLWFSSYLKGIIRDAIREARGD